MKKRKKEGRNRKMKLKKLERLRKGGERGEKMKKGDSIEKGIGINQIKKEKKEEAAKVKKKWNDYGRKLH